MRVLMVSDVYFPRSMVCRPRSRLFADLAEQGVEVRLVVPRYGDESHEGGCSPCCCRPVPGDREDRLWSVGAPCIGRCWNRPAIAI